MNSIDYKLKIQLGIQLGSEFRKRLGGGFYDCFGVQVFHRFASFFWSSVWVELRGQLNDQLKESV